MAQPKDWLGQFIENEIRAVIAWKHRIETRPSASVAPDGRFSDDGSNFRSVITSSMFPPDAKVQISNILSTDDPVTLFVTDGFTRVKAKLSESAVATLEAGLGEKIDADVKGDVLIIREATVKSTPHGPSDGFIQLAIESLEYMFHLRKPLGQPEAVEERIETAKLLEQIIELRRNSWPLLGQSRESTPYPLSVNRTPEAFRNVGRTSGLNETPKSQQPLIISQQSSPVLQDSPSTQRALATQIPTRRKQSGPTLTKDGFEIQEGVNLSRPIGRGVLETNPELSPPSGGKSAPATDASGAKLLDLLGAGKVLGKRKAEPLAEAVHVAEAPLAPSIHAHQDEPGTNSAPPPNLEPEPAPAVPMESNTKQSTSPEETKRKEYRRQKVPRDQQKLLDKPSSWFPPAPGRQFPRPNVPIGLLGRWNAKAASEAKVMPSRPSPVQADPRGIVSERGDADDDEEIATSDTSSSASSSDDEEVPASQWPPSPPVQTKPLLPPDSSMGTNSRPSTADKHAASPSNILNERFVSQERLSDKSPVTVSPRAPLVTDRRASSAQRRPSDVTVGSGAASNRTPATLPQRPDWIPYGFANGRSSKRPPATPNRSNSRPTTSDGNETYGPPLSSNDTFVKPSPPVIDRPRGTPDSVFGSVVRATQFSKSGEDELEMGVPRSLGQDPAIEHRKRRSEHFRAAQRRDWIRNHYTPDSSNAFGFSGIYNAYKKAHPNDVVKLSDFALAIEEVYPPTDGSLSQEVTLQSPKAADNVLPSSQIPPAAAADVHGAAATPPKLSNKPQVASAPSSSSRSGRVLPWTNDTKSTPRLSQGTGVSKVASSAVPASAPWTSSRFSSHKTSLRTETPIKSPDSLRAKQLNEHASTAQRSVAPSMPHSTAQVSTSTNNGARSSNKLPRAAPQQDIIDLTVETTQAKLSTDSAVNRPYTKIKAQDDEMEVDEPRRNKMGVFAEFARAWKSLEPGGAFAAKLGKQKEQKPPPSKPDVLSWKV